MRCLWRNKRPIYYSQYVGRNPVTDDRGYKTGEHVPILTPPVMLMAAVSATHGEVANQIFGSELLYERTVVVDDVNCPITEDSYLYIDVIPGNDVRPDYVVIKVARSLNHVTYAIKKAVAL